MAGGKKGKTESQSKAEPAKGKGVGTGDSASKETKQPKQKGAQAVWVRHILCSKHSKKEEALAKLREGTSSFADVAKEFSEDKAKQGGNLGKQVKGSLQPEFEEVAYSLPALQGAKIAEKDYSYGEVRTIHGYHIILVDKRE
ncbi:peptidyl-prolyl cis-trans isomerase PIN4 [Xylariales sp. AK1849]|nr:peptidyl-prolyl cis-trans isomerase PIN4 [Xylariales sp. AK1849]